MLVEEELDRLMDELDQRIRREQNLNLDDYLKITKQDKVQVRQNFKPLAERRLKQSLVLSELARQEKLTVSPDEMQQQQRDLVAAFESSEEEEGKGPDIRSFFAGPSGQAVVFRDIISRKAVERLTAIARGEAPEIPPDEPPADASAAESESEAVETSGGAAS
jgi:trigger factor